jgi:hypothetical protein
MMLSENQLIKLITNNYGEITWKSQTGWGEGWIGCSVVKNGEIVQGSSGGDCASLEALLDLAAKLDLIEIKIKSA